RVIYATFKIASRPAQMAGLSGLYGFLGRGFEVMRPMGSAQDFLATFIGKERAIVDAIFDGKPDPYAGL
ncbi:MAG: FFLEELY motif protein, partial [Moraxellaceae bacterium]